MRILLISPTQSGIGGTAQHIQALIKFLEKEGHYVETISSDNTFIIPIKGLKNPSFMITAAVRALFKRNFDVVNAHQVPSALAMRLVPGKKILSIHGIFLTPIRFSHGRLLSGITEWFERIATRWADVITAESLNACKYYKKVSEKQLAASTIEVYQVPNGVDISMFTSEDRRYDKQVISVGRLIDVKGMDNLVNIAGQLPSDIHLIILGEGPDEDKIRSVADSHENVHYMGYKEKRDTIALIRGSDILLQPSLFDETSSSILEAMTCGTAVVASDLEGMREMIDGESGILVDPGDPQGFVEAVTGLLEDPEARAKMVGNATGRVRTYSWDTIGKKYVDLYKSLL